MSNLSVGDKVKWVGESWARVDLESGSEGVVVRVEGDVPVVDYGFRVVTHYRWHVGKELILN